MDRILTADPLSRAHGPRLVCPIPPDYNDAVQAAHEGSIAWAEQMGLVQRGTPQMAALSRAHFAGLAARCFPKVTAAQLRLVTDFATLVFFHDDLGDTVCGEHYERDDERLVRTHARMVEALRTGLAAADDPYLTALIEIRERLGQSIGAGWFARLANDLETYLQGVRWEHAVERSGRPLTLAIYRHMRPLTSAVTLFVNMGAAFACPDDPTVGQQPLVRELERIANNHISWGNDIYSYDRERAHGQTANLVVALARDEGLEPHEAVDRAIEVCNEEMAAFTRLEARLPALGIDGADPYVAVLARWLRGSLDWHAESFRYAETQSLTAGPDASVLPGAA